MKATKTLIVLAVTATIFLAAIGVAYGYYITNQTNIDLSSKYTTNTDFWGWFRGCLGFRPRQAYGYQYQPPSNSTNQLIIPGPPQYPYHQNPNQGYYQYRCRRGCWGY